MAKNMDREIRRILREELLHEESLTPPRSGAIVQYERDLRKLLGKWPGKSGLDTKALEALRAVREREHRRSAERQKRLASKQGATLHKGALAQAKALRALVNAELQPIPGGPLLVVLDEPQRISTTPNPAVLTNSRISPGNNFAKIRVDRKNRGRDRLNFAFTWRNTSSRSVLVDAAATLTATGFLDLHVNNGLLGNVGSLEVSTRMSVRRFPFPFAVASGPHFIRSILAFNYPWWPAEDASAVASATVDHSVRNVPLAGNATLLITVSMTVLSDFDDGHGVADFDLGLFGVRVPQVALNVRST